MRSILVPVIACALIGCANRDALSAGAIDRVTAECRARGGELKNLMVQQTGDSIITPAGAVASGTCVMNPMAP